MPIYNSAATLERALSSVVEQGYAGLELIVVDAASRDGTAAILERYAGHIAVLVSEPDEGQSEALNKGFRLATGEVHGWLCGDDALKPGALAHVGALFAGNREADMVIGRARRVHADGSEQVLPPPADVLERIGYVNGIEQPACFWRAALHRRAGEIDESFRFAMDWEWWNRLARAGARALITQRELAWYHFSETNKTSANPEGNVAEMYRVIKRYGPYGGRLADVYDMLYHRFDLKGCYDKPPTASAAVLEEWRATLRELYETYDRRHIDAYNWNWCSLQRRQAGDHAISR